VENRKRKSRCRTSAMNRRSRTRSRRCRYRRRTGRGSSRRCRRRSGGSCLGASLGARGRRRRSCRSRGGGRRRFATSGNSARNPAGFSTRGGLGGPGESFSCSLKGGERIRSLKFSPLVQMVGVAGARTVGLSAKTIPPIQWSSTEQ